jgi:hypothetical protein
MTHALHQMGYTVGAGKTEAVRPGGTSPDNFVTSYELTGRDGKTRRVTADDIKTMVYRGRRPTANVLVPDLFGALTRPNHRPEPLTCH